MKTIKVGAVAGVLAVALAMHAQADDLPSAYDLKTTGLGYDILSATEDRQSNLTIAASYYRRAAAKGNGRAWQLLANAYRHGRGVEQSAFLAAVSYMVPYMMCFAEALPSESAGIEQGVTQGEWEEVIKLSGMMAMLHRGAEGLRPDCGEYFAGDTWVGHVYPNRGNKLLDELVGTYRSLEACRAASLDTIERWGWTNADYECGLNCRREDSGAFRNINVCEDTLR